MKIVHEGWVRGLYLSSDHVNSEFFQDLPPGATSY